VAESSVKLKCDRRDKSNPRWVTLTGQPEPKCTYHCENHHDCEVGKEKCLNHRCVDLTCNKRIEYADLRMQGDINDVIKVGYRASVTCRYAIQA